MKAPTCPPLEAASYVLRIREPDWFEHRAFKGPDTDVNVHVFSAGCPEIDRMLKFRDHLRIDEVDREASTNEPSVTSQAATGKYVQQYVDAKSTWSQTS